MGKFFDALRKSEKLGVQPSAKPLPKRLVETRREEIDALKLERKRLDPAVSNRHQFSDRMDPRLVCALEPDSPEAECFRILRSKLILGSLGKPRNALMVTGALPEDGKSIVAANLAVSIARGVEDYVMLVDCDLRLPSLHQIFGLQAKHGLREYLEDGTSIAPYLLKTPVRKLTLLPAGEPIASPSELLGSEKMRQLIQDLKSRYQDRYIIFDTPPSQFMADTAPLSNMVDNVLVVVRSGKTPKDAILQTLANIGREKIFGLVFNASDEFARDRQYYYKRYQIGK